MLSRLALSLPTRNATSREVSASVSRLAPSLFLAFGHDQPSFRLLCLAATVATTLSAASRPWFRLSRCSAAGILLLGDPTGALQPCNEAARRRVLLLEAPPRAARQVGAPLAALERVQPPKKRHRLLVRLLPGCPSWLQRSRKPRQLSPLQPLESELLALHRAKQDQQRLLLQQTTKKSSHSRTRTTMLITVQPTR